MSGIYKVNIQLERKKLSIKNEKLNDEIEESLYGRDCIY